MPSSEWILITLATVIDSAERHEIFSERLFMTLFNKRTDEVLHVMKVFKVFPCCSWIFYLQKQTLSTEFISILLGGIFVCGF